MKKFFPKKKAPAHKSPPKAKHEEPEPVEPPVQEPLIPPFKTVESAEYVEVAPDDVHGIDEAALHEAAELILGLAHATQATLGTAHGAALINAAKKWVATYIETPS